jgi:formylglycine-generating enzyme required for sulfatase activity
MPEDKSPYGVYGMAGNVSEWTDTIVPSSIESVKVAVIRGANFKTNSEEHAVLTYRDTPVRAGNAGFLDRLSLRQRYAAGEAK